MEQKKYTAAESRYDKMSYSRLGNSGILLPKISLGLWHNFGSVDDPVRSREMLLYAFDNGITHFDIANNYGPIPGSAESTFGSILKSDLHAYRDEILVTNKAGHDMWDGVYGGNSSRKNLIASINASLRRTGLEYFDIFYSHRYDGVTPVEETAQALVDIVRSGKALYVGISKYPVEKAIQMLDILKEAKVPCLVGQYRYSMFERTIEAEIMGLFGSRGVGMVTFSSLAQGLLTNRYLDGIPADSRMAGSSQFLNSKDLTPHKMGAIIALNELACERGESLSQLALNWTLRDERVTSVIIGASSTMQIGENIAALNSRPLSPVELERIEVILSKL